MENNFLITAGITVIGVCCRAPITTHSTNWEENFVAILGSFFTVSYRHVWAFTLKVICCSFALTPNAKVKKSFELSFMITTYRSNLMRAGHNIHKVTTVHFHIIMNSRISTSHARIRIELCLFPQVIAHHGTVFFFTSCDSLALRGAEF